MTSTYGELGAGSQGRSVRFVRHLDATPDEIWAVLTKPEHLRVWLLADASLEPRVGGAVSLEWGDLGHASGTVSVFNPPHVLEYSWVEAAGTSVVRFELQAEADGVHLVLYHRELPASAHAGVGAGWHAHLEALAALLRSEDFDFWVRFHELEPQYEKRVAEL